MTILIDENLDSNWFRVEMSPGYFLGDWFNSNKDNAYLKDDIRSFRSLVVNSPLFKASDVGGDLELFDVTESTTKKSFSAIRAAIWYKRLLCSFPNTDLWSSNYLNITILQINENGEITTDHRKLTNLVSIDHWNVIKEQILEKQCLRIRKGQQLIRYSSKNLTNIRFCGKSKSQLQKWSASGTILQQIRDCLIALNTYGKAMESDAVKGCSCLQLRESGFPQDVSRETSSVRNDPSKKAERMFYLPDGRKEFFEQHAKLAEKYRLHFFPEPTTGLIYIGYAGPHLTI